MQCALKIVQGWGLREKMGMVSYDMLKVKNGLEEKKPRPDMPQ